MTENSDKNEGRAVKKWEQMDRGDMGKSARIGKLSELAVLRFTYSKNNY